MTPARGEGGDSSDEDGGGDGSEGDSEDEEGDEEEVGVDGVGMSEAEERLVASFMNAGELC